LSHNANRVGRQPNSFVVMVCLVANRRLKSRTIHKLVDLQKLQD